MTALRTDLAVCFNVWTSHRTWFWSLIYPDRQGGAIGAAASEAEALNEANAAIERLPQPGNVDVTYSRRSGDSKLIQKCDILKNSQCHISGRREAANDELACSRAGQKGRAKLLPLGAGYSNLWQLTLQQYAARVANA